MFLGESKTRRAFKLHYWFKSNGDFAEWGYFAYWLSCIGKGLRASWEAGLFTSFWGVSFIQYIETVHHLHDKLIEFHLGFVKHGSEYQGSCQIAFQTSPVSSPIVDLVIPYNGMIA